LADAVCYQPFRGLAIWADLLWVCLPNEHLDASRGMVIEKAQDTNKKHAQVVEKRLFYMDSAGCQHCCDASI
jgi:hypothetical protein